MELELIPGKDFVRIVERTTEDLDYHKKLVDNGIISSVGWRGLSPILKEVLL